MRYIRIVFLAGLAVALMTVALANRELVTLHFLPGALAGFVGASNGLQVPLFLVIFAGIVAGLLIGFVWEWLRAHRVRAQTVRAKRDVSRLTREVSRLKGGSDEHTDDVLALLEKSAKGR